jgi:hypothetical protein
MAELIFPDSHIPAGEPPSVASSSRHISSRRQIKRSEMTAAEQKYGIAPVPDDSVDYQPEVIVVGGGAESVRSKVASWSWCWVRWALPS